MAEVLSDLNRNPSVNGAEQQPNSDGILTYRDRLRRGLSDASDGALSFVNLSASIGIARDDLRLTRRAMDTLDEPFGGLIGRQAEADQMSMELEADVILDFRRNAQRAGHIDTDAMPADARTEAAHLAAEQRREDLLAELTANNPGWSQEDLQDALETRLGDIATLLSMDAEQRDAYLTAQLEYHELRSAVPEIQSELSELRAERSQRLSKIGKAAVSGLVGLVGRVRDLPNALSARAMVAGMSISDSIRSTAPEKRRRAFIGTAAGLAIAGIASYIAYRAGHAPSGNGANYALANSSSPLPPTGVGIDSGLPTGVGVTRLPGGVGEFTIPTSVGEATLPSGVGANVPAGVGVEGGLPTGVGSGVPKGVGSPEAVIPSGVGVDTQPLPTSVGSEAGTPTGVGEQKLPTSVGGTETNIPTGVGGEGIDLSGAHNSSELFGGNTSVENWPTKIRVSAWNSETLDGSLTGISRQMLIRSGVPNPSSTQIDTLVSALRPQAQSNGWLQRGQELDLRPATKVLSSLLKK